MQVILLKELRTRGGEGDVIDVARGYANNYLFRQGYAVPATPGNLKQLEQRRHNIEKREAVRVEEANALAERMNGLNVKILVQVGDEGQLFGSVTGPMVADAIMEALDIEFDKRRVQLGKPIKALGEFPIDVNVYRTIKATVNVTVAGKDANGDEIVTDEVAAAEAAAEAAGDAVADAIEAEVAEVAAEAVAEEIAEEVAETAEAIEADAE